MSVAELIEKLQTYPQDIQIYINDMGSGGLVDISVCEPDKNPAEFIVLEVLS